MIKQHLAIMVGAAALVTSVATSQASLAGGYTQVGSWAGTALLNQTGSPAVQLAMQYIVGYNNINGDYQYDYTFSTTPNELVTTINIGIDPTVASSITGVYSSNPTTFMGQNSVLVSWSFVIGGGGTTPASGNIGFYSTYGPTWDTAAVVDGHGISWASPQNVPSPAAVPEPSTVVAGALLLLPFGVSTMRILRKNKVS